MAKTMLRLFQATTVGVSIVALGSMAIAQDYTGKWVLHIDSYHEGNYWNTTISETVEATLAGHRCRIDGCPYGYET